MTLSLAEVNAQAHDLAIRLAETKPPIAYADQVAQLSNFYQRNRPSISQAEAHALAVALVNFTSTRPRSIIAEAAADPVGSFLQGLGGLSGWQQIVFRMAVGAVGVVLILFGIALIGGEVTLSNVAKTFGKQIGAGIRGKG